MLDIEVRGADECIAGLTRISDELHGAPMVQAMRDATMLVTASAKKNAPVNTGRLRGSITPEVMPGVNGIKGVVGSNIDYAPYVELGTRPHWPPYGPIEYWVRRKFQLRGDALRATTWGVMRKIAAHGTKARRYLQHAFEDNAQRVANIIGKAVGVIISKK